MADQKIQRLWIVSWLCLALFLGGCNIKQEGQFDAYSLSTQIDWDGELCTMVLFQNATILEVFNLHSYEITSPQGTKYPIKGMGSGLPKGGGRSWYFTVDGGQIPKETRQIHCQFNFGTGSCRFSLTSIFIRNGTHGREWRADEECLKIEIRKE